jgi:hypothetical protein
MLGLHAHLIAMSCHVMSCHAVQHAHSFIPNSTTPAHRHVTKVAARMPKLSSATQCDATWCERVQARHRFAHAHASLKYHLHVRTIHEYNYPATSSSMTMAEGTPTTAAPPSNRKARVSYFYHSMCHVVVLDQCP